MFTIFGSEKLKCSLFSALKTLELYTIFKSENLGGLMFDASLSGSPGGEAPGKAGGFGGPRGPPMRGMVGGTVTVNGFWRMVLSRGMVKAGLV